MTRRYGAQEAADFIREWNRAAYARRDAKNDPR